MWDVANGAKYDLLNPINQNNLKRLVLQSAFTHFAPPCSSFSLARGAYAPRSRQYPKGKPGLNERDAEKVRIGNILMLLCCRLICLMYDSGLACSLEQPQTSRMWICPSTIRMSKYTNANCVVIHFRAWGTAWKKPTTFMYVNMSALANLHRICHTRCGKCEHTGKPHQTLQGKGPGGVNWTLIAQPYPRGLCSAFAQCVAAHFQSRYINKLSMWLYYLSGSLSLYMYTLTLYIPLRKHMSLPWIMTRVCPESRKMVGSCFVVNLSLCACLTCLMLVWRLRPAVTIQPEFKELNFCSRRRNWLLLLYCAFEMPK